MDFFDCPKQGGARLKEMVLQNDQTQILYWPFNSHLKNKGGTATARYAKDEIWIKQWRRTDQPESVTFAWKLYRGVRQHIESVLGSKTIRLMVAKPKTVRVISSIIHRRLKRPAEKILAVPDAIHYQANLEVAVVIGLECVFKVDEGFEKAIEAWRFAVDKVNACSVHSLFEPMSNNIYSNARTVLLLIRYTNTLLVESTRSI